MTTTPDATKLDELERLANEVASMVPLGQRVFLDPATVLSLVAEVRKGRALEQEALGLRALERLVRRHLRAGTFGAGDARLFEAVLGSVDRSRQEHPVPKETT